MPAISKNGKVLRDQTHRELVDRPFQFQKRSEYFFGTNDETLPVAMRVNNPDRSSFKIQSCDPAQAETGVMKIVSDDFPLLHTLSR